MRIVQGVSAPRSALSLATEECCIGARASKRALDAASAAFMLALV